jgi:hypothetical protein
MNCWCQSSNVRRLKERSLVVVRASPYSSSICRTIQAGKRARRVRAKSRSDVLVLHAPEPLVTGVAAKSSCVDGRSGIHAETAFFRTHFCVANLEVRPRMPRPTASAPDRKSTRAQRDPHILLHRSRCPEVVRVSTNSIRKTVEMLHIVAPVRREDPTLTPYSRHASAASRGPWCCGPRWPIRTSVSERPSGAFDTLVPGSLGGRFLTFVRRPGWCAGRIGRNSPR